MGHYPTLKREFRTHGAPWPFYGLSAFNPKFGEFVMYLITVIFKDAVRYTRAYSSKPESVGTKAREMVRFANRAMSDVREVYDREVSDLPE